MARVSRTGNDALSDIGSAPSAGSSRLFDTSSPASWTLFFWFVSLAIIAFIYFSL